jgi:hypothetical protein
MEFLNVLSREEMRNVKGGSMGVCRIYGENGWSSCGFSPAAAESFYNGFSEITGYCCASCGTGNFSNAEPCYS